MASVIYIMGSSEGPGKFLGEPNKKFSLVDSEITINYETEFGSFNDLVPSIGDVIEKVSGFVTGMGGQTSTGLLNLKNLFAVQRWQNTKPPMVTVKLHFYTKTNPQKDVLQEMQDLINLFILTKNPNGGFDVPGISLRTMRLAMEKGTEEDKKAVGSQGKFCSIKIPGMIFLPIAMVTQAQPTYSSERTESGCPLWGILDITFAGLYPATDETYDNFPSASGIQATNEKVNSALFEPIVR